MDTRIGTPSPIADADRPGPARSLSRRRSEAGDRALRGDGARDIELRQRIDRAAADFDDMEKETHRLAGLYQPAAGGGLCRCAGSRRTAFDKTELLLAGQALAQVAVVRHAGYVTLAARSIRASIFSNVWHFGRNADAVTLPEKRLGEVLARLCAIE